MDSKKENKTVSLQLSNDESIVFLEWLSRFNKEEHPALFVDQSEQRILFDLEAVLEKVVLETFEEDYEVFLSQARGKIRDQDK